MKHAKRTRDLLALAGLSIALAGCGGPSRTQPAPLPMTARPASVNPGVMNGAAARTDSGVNAGVPGGAVLRVDPWAWENRQGRVLHTRTFSIYTTENSPMIADRLPGFMEAAIDHYVSAITPLPRPESRLETFVMGDRGQWQRITLAMMGEQGRPLTLIERGGFAFAGRAYLFDIGTADTLSIAAHEGWHQYTQRTFKDRLPTWAEEGVATLMEGHRWAGQDVVYLPWFNLERYDRLREAVSKRTLLPMEVLLSTSPDQLMQRGYDAPVTWYAQLWALLHFLREGEGGKYRRGLENLLADAANGRMGRAMAAQLNDARAGTILAQRSGIQVFRAYFGPDLPAVEREFRAFVTALVGPGGRNAVVEGRAPDSIRPTQNRGL